MPGFRTLKEEGTTLTAAEIATVESISVLGDPGADRILFWDESANDWKFLTVGGGLTITDTTLSATGTGANTALSNLAAVAINTSLVSDTDSTDDLGASDKYWANVYADKVYLNGTATLDGSVAGAIGIVGNQEIIGSTYIKWLDATRTTTYAYLQSNVTETTISAVNTPLSIKYGAVGADIGASLDTAGNWIFNYAAGNCDFTINKQTAGAAYVYDAGDDTSTFGSAIIGLSSLTLGTAGTASGSVVLKGTTSGVVTLTTADAAGTYTLTLPTSDGDAGQYLQTDGSGVLSWQTVGGGTATAVTVANEATDETCFPLFVTAATGDLGPKSNASLTFNSSTGVLGAAGLALGAGSITMTGSIATTDNRVTKGWFTDLEVTNAIAGSVTGNAGTVTNATLTTALTVNTGTVTLTGNVANSSVLTIGAGAVSVSGSNTGDQDLSGLVTKSTFNAHTVLYATTDDTPVALEVTEQTLVGRLTGGNISAVAIGIADNNVLQVDDASAADNDYAKFTAGGIEGVPYATVLSDIGALPLAGGTMSGNITLGENTSIALDPAGSDDGKYSGITVTGVAGDTLAFGDLVTLDKDDSRWEKVDISVAAAATGDARGIMGMAVSAGNDGDAITILLHGIIRADANFPALTIGAAVYASTTGDIVVTQPSTTDYVIRLVGYALTADEIYFNPENDWISHT